MTTPFQLKFPLPISRLLDWIPHRPPMVWVDEVLSVGPDGGLCRVKVPADRHDCGSGGIRPSSLVEWVAQSFAFVRITQSLSGFQPQVPAPKRAFLVSIQDGHYENTEFLSGRKASSCFHIHVGQFRVIGPLTLLEGRVETEEGFPVFKVKLKVFADSG